MFVYTAKRIAYSLFALLAVTVVIFLLLHLLPGDPARVMLGIRATPDKVQQLHEELGLDGSLLTQYATFMGNLLQGNLGTSIIYETSALGLVLERLPITFYLIGYSTVISLIIAVPLSIYGALRRDGVVDHFLRVVLIAGIATPQFWIGTLLILFFSLRLGLFPPSGYGDTFREHLSSMFLPALTLVPFQVALLSRNLRNAMIDTLRLPYVTFARIRGLPETTVVQRHILRTSLASTVTLIALNVSALLAGAVVVENVFAIPGAGTLLVQATFARDYPVVQAIAIIFAIVVITVNLITDFVYLLLDPRVRLRE